MKDQIADPLICASPIDGSPPGESGEAIINPEDLSRIQHKLDDYENKMAEQKEKGAAQVSVRDQFLSLLQQTILPVLDDLKLHFKSEVLKLDYVCVQNQGDPSVVMRLVQLKENDALNPLEQPHFAFRLEEAQGKVTVNTSYGKDEHDGPALDLAELTAETVQKSLVEWLELSLDKLSAE